MIEVYIFLLGACLGSFYLVLGKRLPVGKNVVTDRSKCDNCNHTLSWWELIPIVSYIILLGRCHKCKKVINPLNIIMEIVCASLFLIGYKYWGLSYNYFVFLIVTSLLLIIFVSDFSFYIINDSPLLVASFMVIGLQLYYFNVNYLVSHLISGFGLFLAMYAVKLFGDLIFKRDSLGGGDIKLSFVIGLILGFRLGLCSLILSTFLALPYSCAFLMLKKNNEVPYGPFLVASLFLVFAFIPKFENLLDLIFLSL